MTRLPPTIRPPTRTEIRSLAREHYLDLTDEEVDAFADLAGDLLANYEVLDGLPAESHETPYTDRTLGHRPTGEANPYNAVATRCRVEGSEDGPLSGYDVAVKDNVAVAGIEMACGSKLLEGYVPAWDATIVTRLLDAGATVTSKANMSDMAASATGEITATGPVLNPHDTDHLAGGSSGGSAVAVATGDADLAIGTDQGGSVRVPASWCGCVGMKPSFGLVPYTGIVGRGHTRDHAGPFAASVTDCALALDVLAGPDGFDPRQRDVTVGEYATAATDADPADLSVGVLDEGFGREGGDDASDETVRDAIGAFESAGATVRSVSVSMHSDGTAAAIAAGIRTEGFTTLMRNDGVGYFQQERHDPRFAVALGTARRTRGDDLPPNVKFSLVVGEYMSQNYFNAYYARAQNAVGTLARAYDDALADVDVLALPTAPRTAIEREDDLPLRELLDRTMTATRNAAPFNVTGHPAITVPCGTLDGLPVGLSFVGRVGDDEGVVRAAAAFEAAVGG